MGCTPPFSSSLFVGCTWASPLSFSQMHFLLFCGIYSNLLLLREAPPMSSFIFFFCRIHSQLLFFPGGTHASPSPSVGCTCTSLLSRIYPHIRSPCFFFWDALTHLLLLFLGCTPTSSSFFLQDTLTQVLLLWDRLAELFFSGCTQASPPFFPTPKPHPLQGPVSPRPTALPYGSQQLNLPQRWSHMHPKNPTEDLFGKISTEGIWGRE